MRHLLFSLTAALALVACRPTTTVPDPEPLTCAPDRAANCALLGERVLMTPDATDAELGAAAPMLATACDAGISTSCAGLAGLYDHGWGVPQDDAAARGRYEQSCAGGEACVELGRMLLDGRGGDADPPRALTVFADACATGHAEACALEGLLLVTSDIVPRDVVRGEALLRAACEDGIAWACDGLPTAP